MISPYLIYADAPAAIDFLCKAFGFVERCRYPMPDGRIGHAELTRGADVVMLASIWDGFGTSPLNLPDVHGQIYCTVDDVEAHYAQAFAAGATIVTQPADDGHGSRSYRSLDPEGHRWTFVESATP